MTLLNWILIHEPKHDKFINEIFAYNLWGRVMAKFWWKALVLITVVTYKNISTSICEKRLQFFTFFCSLNNLNQVWLVNFPSRSKPWLGCAVKFRPKIDLWFHLIDSFWERGYSGLLLFVGENARGYFARGYFLPLWWTYSSYLTVLREFLATSAK